MKSHSPVSEQACGPSRSPFFEVSQSCQRAGLQPLQTLEVSPLLVLPLLSLLSLFLKEFNTFIWNTAIWARGFPHSSAGKKPARKATDLGSIPRLGRSPGEGNGNPIPYSCPETPMGRGAWQATVHGVTRVRHELVTIPPPPPPPPPIEASGHTTLLKSIYRVKGRLNTSAEKNMEVRCSILPLSHLNDQCYQVTRKRYPVVKFIGYWVLYSQSIINLNIKSVIIQSKK